MGGHGQSDDPIPARNANPKVCSVFFDAEPGQVVESREQPVSSKSRDAGIGVSPRYEYTSVGSRVIAPLDGETVGDVFGGHSDG